MILSGPGVFQLRCKENADTCSLDWASMSASETSFLKAWWGDDLVEDALIGPYGSPHTWWPGANPLLGRHGLGKGRILRIELGPGVKLRLEGDLGLIDP